jgi:hypothetical protein
MTPLLASVLIVLCIAAIFGFAGYVAWRCGA